MFRFIFSLIPWWLFAIFAATLAPATYSLYEEYQRDQMLMEQALASGPPEVVPVRKFGPAFANELFREVVLSGTLRADLGVQNITFGETSYSFVVLDDAPTGPVVAILIRNSDAGVQLPQLVDSVDSSGRVVVQGFLQPARAGEMSRQLAVRNGVTREVYVIDPYFGSRRTELSSKVTDSLSVFGIMAGITALFALIALWKFRSWRKRRATKRATRPKPAAASPTAASSEVKHISGKSREEVSPWGSFQPQPKPAPAGNSRMVKPQTPAQAKANALPKAKPSAKPRKSDDTPTEPEFESVFPGGGSGFRFKTADEIIRQSFGTLSALEYRKPKD